MKILVLGHNGMLGNAVFKYFNKRYDVEVINNCRWDSDEYKNRIINSNADFIINCVGAIHQKNYDNDYYNFLNVKLPEFLESCNKNIIHPSTDCIFSGNISKENKYSKDDIRDAFDPYGKSKADIDEMICNKFNNTKIIRTSIVGHEIKGFHSLLDWFLNISEDEVLNGYINYYWNGITTLQWAKIAEEIIINWENTSTLIQVGSEGISKCELLRIMGTVYNKKNIINDFEMNVPLNKMLISDYNLPTIKEQLIELKKFYIDNE